MLQQAGFSMRWKDETCNKLSYFLCNVNKYTNTVNLGIGIPKQCDVTNLYHKFFEKQSQVLKVQIFLKTIVRCLY